MLARSTDRGRTFQQANFPFKLGSNDMGRSSGERLAVDPNAGHVLFFGSRAAGLWKSADWRDLEIRRDLSRDCALPVRTGERRNPIGIVFVQFDESSGTRGTPTPTIYCGAASEDLSVFRSSDGGESWGPVPGQPSGLLPNHMVRAADSGGGPSI